MPKHHRTEQTKAPTMKALQDFFNKHGYSPTYPELGKMLGVSPNAAFNRVMILAKDKKVKFRYGEHRNIILQ